ncbi:hypothetical protein [Lactiplantibacillus fabifermentans]|uniref:Uncharacterized protein n=2 Tax=Lactiplantibacillus fabifermentans TaxID=483011 RepID=A0A0R2NPW4_9LACO|nr:hypothetical protein [Lactiplantibacillus fabifermentans]ETY74509.1 hypothetical protein LFAB_06850 [Lactiplantibacillus fabifermentans T30PCM01]KRO27743.1 hypothetical protein DY78_GL002993 [Lactiplantibacillus fabifermentans DSM 21115]
MTNDNKKIDSATLSTHGKLSMFNEGLKSGLANGQKFTALMDELIDTSDGEVLLSAAQKLADFKLDSAYVTFPHQYKNADYYLIFMSRLLSMHQDEKAILNSRAHSESLYHVFDAITDDYTFLYQVVTNDNGGAYYTEQTTGESLFYIHLERRLLRFNSRAFTNLFINKLLLKGTGVDQINSVLATLIAFGHYLRDDFGFNVDFNILDVDNAAKYELREANLNGEVVDKLFVTAAQNNHMLRNSPKGHGAEIELQSGLIVDIFDAGKPGSAKWVLTVRDQGQRVSWFDVLLHFDFMRNWYLANIDALEIKADPLVFA